VGPLRLGDSALVRRVAICFAVLSLLLAISGCGSTPALEAATPRPSAVFSTYKLTGDVQPVRDPSITRQGNTYYLFSTDDGVPTNGSIPIRCSSDLHAWSDCGHVFEGVPSWVMQKLPGVAGLWAPDISYFNHLYHLYYVGSIFGTNQSVIGLATNTTLDRSDPGYAWLDRGQVLSSTTGNDFNALDPNILIDGDGSIWLTYGSFWTGIKQAPIDPLTGMISATNPETFSLASRPDDDPPAVEGAFLVRHGSYYYLFVSFGLCCTVDPYQSNYSIMVGRGTSVHGPFFDMNGAALMRGGGTELLAGSNTGWNAPGGESVFIDPENGNSTIVFHAHTLPAGTSYLFADALTWNDGWPQITP
jgi:arabinan endo-1,5-alpha-L-arabinosidase